MRRDSIPSKYTKIDFPQFDGDNPCGWIYHCERFFTFYNINNDDKIYLATIHMKGKAIDWFQGYETTTNRLTWRSFSKDLIT